jgi:peptidoglycan hydrolase-like protein with peptidoglycan-binding domain
MAPIPDRTITLTYTITGMLLCGSVCGKVFSVTAVSGGGAGGKRYYSPLLANKPFMTHVKSQRISRRVGIGMLNQPDDVKIIQTMLNDAFKPSPNLEPDGICGPKTVSAIMRFQKAIGMKKPDGWIAPDRYTFKQLLEHSGHWSVTASFVLDGVVLPPFHKTYRGGPPPLGPYTLNVSEDTREGRIEMKPDLETYRSGLQIHGTGIVGSDGCIVIEDKRSLTALRLAVKSTPTGHAKLTVTF